MTQADVTTNKLYKTPVSDGPSFSPFPFRYGHDRSADSIKGNQPGQDSLSVKWSKKRMAVTQCDGVSQSFFGDLAAEHLCKNLSEFLLTFPTDQDIEQMQHQLLEYLNQLSAGFKETVDSFSLDHIEPVFLRNVLEKKRDLGSEAVFSSLLLDKSRYLALLIWAGDSRIRIWKNQNEVTSDYFSKQDFLTEERWSSHKGIIGNLHLKILSPDEFDQLVLYSDGLAIADNISSLFLLDNIKIENLINQSKALAGSDDITFFQMTSSLQPAWHVGKKNTFGALSFDNDREPGKLFIEWTAPPGQNTWELAAVGDLDFSIVETQQDSFKVLIDEIPQAGVFFAIRAVNHHAVTEWSPWFFYKPPQSEPVIQPKRETPKTPPVYQIPDPVDKRDDQESFGQYRIRPEPIIPTTNKKWQLALIAMIVVFVLLLSTFFVFKNNRSHKSNLFLAIHHTYLPMLFNAPVEIKITTESDISLEDDSTATIPSEPIENLYPFNTITPPIDNSESIATIKTPIFTGIVNKPIKKVCGPFLKIYLSSKDLMPCLFPK